MAALALVLTLLVAACDSGQTSSTPPNGPQSTSTPIGQPIDLPPTPTMGYPVSQLRISQAQDIVTRLASGDYAGVEATFDPALKSSMPAASLESMWGDITAQFGAFQGQVAARGEQVQELDVVTVSCAFENGVLDFRISMDEAGRVTDLRAGVGPMVNPAPTRLP